MTYLIVVATLQLYFTVLSTIYSGFSFSSLFLLHCSSVFIFMVPVILVFVDSLIPLLIDFGRVTVSEIQHGSSLRFREQRSGQDTCCTRSAFGATPRLVKKWQKVVIKQLVVDFHFSCFGCFVPLHGFHLAF